MQCMSLHTKTSGKCINVNENQMVRVHINNILFTDIILFGGIEVQLQLKKFEISPIREYTILFE